jgi:hypothetical protein
MILKSRKKKRKMKQGAGVSIQSIRNIKLEISNNWKTSKRDHVAIEINLVENSCYIKKCKMEEEFFKKNKFS